MHKLILEFETLSDLQRAVVNINKPEGEFRCSNRLQLLKEVRDLYRESNARGDEPSLTELKNVIWKFVS
jgi:hypothetical protein